MSAGAWKMNVVLGKQQLLQICLSCVHKCENLDVISHEHLDVHADISYGKLVDKKTHKLIEIRLKNNDKRKIMYKHGFRKKNKISLDYLP
jgi:hypothetical protein